MPVFPLGPAGGGGGRPFNDFFDVQGGFQAPPASVATLDVNAGQTLDHLLVTYRSGGTTFPPVQHGASNGGSHFHTFFINLDGGERLITVHGWLNVFDGTLEVRGFQFATNFNRHSDVLGANTGEAFFLDAPPNGEITAFWGRQGLFFDAVGVMVRIP
jgi:jacalin-like lectin domain-containing protein